MQKAAMNPGLESPVARSALPASAEPFWVACGAGDSDVRIGYRKTSDGGLWLGALTLRGETECATLGPANDPGAAPGALSFAEATEAALRWADQQRDRVAERDAVAIAARAVDAYVASRAQRDAEVRIAAMSAERDAARKAQKEADERAARFKAERDSAFSARATLLTRLAEMSADRDFLARTLARTYQRPWRPIKHFLNYCSLTALSAAAAPFSAKVAARFARSAAKRSPERFDGYLARPQAAEIAAEAHSHVAPSEADRGSILVADWRIPRPDVSAGEAATVGMLKDLLALGYKVTFVPTDMQPSPGYQSDLESLGVEVVTQERGYEHASQFVEFEGYRFGVFYLIRMDVVEAILPNARRVSPNARIVFHAPDLYFLREMRGAELSGDPQAIADAAATKARELAAMRSSDHVVIVSPAELPHLRAELAEKPISVFPALYSPVASNPPGFRARRNIFFLGGFKHTPNVGAVEWFAEKVWPLVRADLPGVEFHIVGAEAPPSVLALGAKPGIRVIGYAPDLEPILTTMRVGVAPLLFGAGIKGKVGVTMGAGVPCVCTTIAAEGMGVVDGVHARIADDARAFAEAVVSVYTDEEQWTRLSASGQALVEERFGDAANRADFLAALNDARAIPLSLFIEHCQNAKRVALRPLDPAIEPDVSIVIPVYNKWRLTRACLNSVALTCAGAGPRYEVILADDGSTDETTAAADIFPGLRVARTPANVGFLRNCNNAVAQARGRYVVLLNNDTIVLPGWLKALYDAMESDPDIAIAGSKLLYPDGLVQEAGAVLYKDGKAANLGRGKERDTPFLSFPREVDYISGASIMVRSDFWRARGGFDERYKNAYCEDSDLAMEARSAGKYVWYVPSSEVIHFEHQSYAEQAVSRNKELQEHNTEILLDKWREVLRRDHLGEYDWPRAAAMAERHVPAAARRRRRSGNLNILYFSPFPSHPANHGNQATIQQFGKRFQALGHRVHFALLRSHMFDAEAEQAMREAWDTFDLLNNTKGLGSNGQEIPFDDWYEAGLGEDVRVLCAKHDIDVVFCSYVFQSRLLELAPAHTLKVIDTHDKMGGRYDMLRANGQPLEFFSCSPEEEGAYLRRADVVVARREEEARYFDSVTGRKTAIVIPHVEPARFIDRTFDRLDTVGLVASPNRINLAIVREFLDTVERVCGDRPPFAVHVAGQVKEMADRLPAAEGEIFRKPWVRMLGFVPDIEAFYRSMDVIASPVTMGTGINVKTVQAMAFGMPLVTTRWGSKGIETGDPMHDFADIPALVRGLAELAKQPAKLNTLAAVSRERYSNFQDAANASIQALFQSKKLLPD